MARVPPEGIAASANLLRYFAEHLARRRRAPVDDLTGALIAAEIDGERLEDRDIIAFLFLMIIAGNETTTKLLGNAAFHLTRDPGQLARVFDDPAGGLVDAWVEETLRYDTSTQLLARLLVDDVTVEDVTAPAGAQLVMLLGSANHDERVFTDPERFDLDRDPAELNQIMSFGGGRHYCLGANLARLEARVILRSLVAGVAQIEVDHANAVRFYSANVRGFAHLPMKAVAR